MVDFIGIICVVVVYNIIKNSFVSAVSKSVKEAHTETCCNREIDATQLSDEELKLFDNIKRMHAKRTTPSA